jgi:hypothetical protein
MKLDRVIPSAFAVVAVALACGCSSTPSTRPSLTAANATAPVPDTVGVTNLMSAELAGPAPKVGKAHLAVDDSDMEVGATGNVLSEESTREEKTARRSDGSHRSGGFGSSK